MFLMSLRMMLSSRSLLLLPLAVLGLSGCSAPPKVDNNPQPLGKPAASGMPAVPPPAVEQGLAVQGAPAAEASGISPLEARVLALEKNMIGVQSEVASSRPILRKVDTIERNFRALSLELDRIDREYAIPPLPEEKEKTEKKAESPPRAVEPSSSVVQPNASPAVKRTYVPKPVFRPLPTKAEAPAPVKPSARSLMVRNLRIGEKSGEVTRVVLDTNSPARLNYDLDNNEKILVIELPNAGWAAQKSETLTHSPLVASYKADSDKTGSRLVLQLRKEAAIVSTARLPAEKGSGDRVYLDIAPKK